MAGTSGHDVLFALRAIRVPERSCLPSVALAFLPTRSAMARNGAKQPIRLGNSDRTDAVVEQLLMPAGTVAKWSRATVMVGKYGAMCERSR